MEDSISFDPTMCGVRVSPECMALIHRGEVHREQDLEWVGTLPGDTNRRGDTVKVGKTTFSGLLDGPFS
jgi:hypothetical protein